MKRYFCEGKEITEEEAKEIKKKNDEYSNSEDMKDWSKIKFVSVIK